MIFSLHHIHLTKIKWNKNSIYTPLVELTLHFSGFHPFKILLFDDFMLKS